MDRGQHLRLMIGGHEGSSATLYVTMAKSLTAHFSAQLEDSTTKDSTDATTGQNWMEYELVERSGEIQFEALLAVTEVVGDDQLGARFEKFLTEMEDEPIFWELAYVHGANNRQRTTGLCSGKGKITNLSANGQNRQNATFNGTIAVYGDITVLSA